VEKKGFGFSGSVLSFFFKRFFLDIFLDVFAKIPKSAKIFANPFAGF